MSARAGAVEAVALDPRRPVVRGADHVEVPGERDLRAARAAASTGTTIESP